MSYNFINCLNSEFRSVVESYISFEKLLLEHTLLKYYVMFLPKDKRREAIEYAISNKPNIQKHLPIEKSDQYYLRYCPMCVEEDRANYGEAYFHINHSLSNIHVCAKHCCELIDTKVVNTKKKSDTGFVALEELIEDMVIVKHEESNINIRVAKYIDELLNSDIGSDVLIGDFLTGRLSDEYFMSKRGEQRNINKLWVDLTKYFSGLNSYDVSKSCLSKLFRNDYLNVYYVVLLAMFENISVKDIGNRKEEKKREELFDEEVRQLYKVHKSYVAVGKIVGVNKEVVRQIIIGAYDKHKKCSK